MELSCWSTGWESVRKMERLSGETFMSTRWEGTLMCSTQTGNRDLSEMGDTVEFWERKAALSRRLSSGKWMGRPFMKKSW